MGSWQISVGIAALAIVLLLTALTLPPNHTGNARRARRIHLAYGFALVFLCGTAGWFWNMDYRITRASRVAERLADGHYPSEARVPMALIFFEKNKSLYPDSYAEMLEYIRAKGCIFPGKSMDDKLTMECLRNQVETSIYFRGMLRAVAPPIPEMGEGGGH